MKVILSLTSPALWQKLYPNINAIHVESLVSINSMPEGLILVTTLQDICDGAIIELLENSEEITIFYQQAEYSIGEAISHSKQFSDSLDQWRSQIVSLLNIKKKNRRKIKLVNLDQLLNQPDFEVILSRIIETEVQSVAELTEIAPYHLLLAKQAIQQADLTTLNTLLFASSEVVGNSPILEFDIQKLIEDENVNVAKISAGQEKSNLFSRELIIAHDEVHSLNETILELRKTIEDANKARFIAIKSTNEMGNAHKELLMQQQSSNKVLQIEKQSLLNEFGERVAAMGETNKQLTFKISTTLKSLLKEQERIKQKNEKLHKFSQKNKKLVADFSELEVFYINKVEESYKVSESLKQQNESQRETIGKQIQQIHELVADFSELEVSYINNVEESYKVSESLKQQNESLRETIGKQTQQIHELIEKKKTVQSETIISQKKLQRELKKSQSELNLFKVTSAAYVQKINSLETEMTTIKESVMWKTSAPLRALSNVISKKDRNKKSLQQDMALIISSKYFDMKWYLKSYPDVAAANINPAEHYLKFGAKEGRYCGPIFDAIWYLNKYSDVAESGMNPLLHFIKYGEPEGRQASPKLLELNAKK
jgi:hypothetical protein